MIKNNGYVYCFKCEDVYYKIGRTSSDPFSRLSSMQTGNPFEISFVWCVYVDDCLSVERIIHETYKDFKVRGEWYSLSDRQAREANRIALRYIGNDSDNDVSEPYEVKDAEVFARNIFDMIFDFGHVSSKSNFSFLDGNLIIKDYANNKEIKIKNIQSYIDEELNEQDVCLMIFSKI